MRPGGFCERLDVHALDNAVVAARATVAKPSQQRSRAAHAECGLAAASCATADDEAMRSGPCSTC